MDSQVNKKVVRAAAEDGRGENCSALKFKWCALDGLVNDNGELVHYRV